MDRGLVRILFELEGSNPLGSGTERLWAEPVAEGRFRLKNSPFLAYGVSFEDVVFAESRDGQLCFKGVSIRGGHSTYRLILSGKGRAGTDGFETHWKPLMDLGCTFEEGNALLSVDVPQSADIYAVYRLLETGESAGVWEFEEGHCGHPLSDDQTGGEPS